MATTRGTRDDQAENGPTEGGPLRAGLRVTKNPSQGDASRNAPKAAEDATTSLVDAPPLDGLPNFA